MWFVIWVQRKLVRHRDVIHHTAPTCSSNTAGTYYSIPPYLAGLGDRTWKHTPGRNHHVEHW